MVVAPFIKIPEAGFVTSALNEKLPELKTPRLPLALNGVLGVADKMNPIKPGMEVSGMNNAWSTFGWANGVVAKVNVNAPMSQATVVEGKCNMFPKLPVWHGVAFASTGNARNARIEK